MAVSFHIGTYDKAGGQGLVPAALAEDGTITLGEPYREARNASFGARAHGLVYLVDEQDEGALGVHRQTGERWERLARVPSGGAAPCYLAIDPAAKRLALANYENGTAALYRLDAHGLPTAPPVVFQDHGSGPNAGRQEGPHAHCVRFHDGALYLVDLGADHVMRLALSENGFGEASVAFTAPAGAGPRHLLFHPSRRLAVLLTELAATLTLLRVTEQALEALHTVSTAPTDFAGDNAGGHLALSADGNRIYASNRGHDSIALFAPEGERLELLQRIPSGGKNPRHFAFIADKLLVAHEKDGRVTAFTVAADGTLASLGGGITVPGACFVLA